MEAKANKEEGQCIQLNTLRCHPYCFYIVSTLLAYIARLAVEVWHQHCKQCVFFRQESHLLVDNSERKEPVTGRGWVGESEK